MTLLRCPDTIVFGVDGTLLDSKHIKRESWLHVFNDRSAEDNEVLQKMVDAQVGDRYAILRRTFDQLRISGDEPSIEILILQYAQRYAELVEEGFENVGLFIGVYQALEKLSFKFPLYVHSRTPDQELRERLYRFGIGDFFEDILGSSITKVEALQKIAAMKGIETKQILFVGDEDIDWVAAKEAGTMFLGIADEDNEWVSKEKCPSHLVTSVAYLPVFLDRIIPPSV